MKPRTLIVRAAGTNCEMETAHAFQLAGADTTLLHINRIIEKPELLSEFGILVFPGGLTYGDDVAAGKILANEITMRIAEPLHRFVERGSLVLGIDNGFHVLVKSGILPGWEEPEPQVTLTDNLSGRFINAWYWLEPVSTKCVFTSGITEPIYLPVAHAEGRFLTRTIDTLNRLEANDQIVLRYTNPPGTDGPLLEGANPSGSERDIAAICDETGRVLGMLPHPERYITASQHPRWTRGEGKANGDGLQFFKNAVAAAVDFAATS